MKVKTKTKAQMIFACLLAFVCCRSAQTSSANTSAATPPLLDHVLNTYLEASGGRETLLSVNDRLCTGRLTWQFPGQDPPEVVIPALVFASGPERWRLSLETSVGPQGMGNDGSEGWVQNSDRIYGDDKQRRSKLAFLFSARGPLYLADYFPDLNQVSREKVGQQTVYRVASLGSGREQEYLCFDARTGRLVQIGDDLKLGDYREVQGVTLPFRIEVSRGENTATYTFDRIQHNVSLSPEKTSRPSQDHVFPDAFAGLTETRVLPLLLDFPSGHEDMNIPCRDGRYLYDLIRSRSYKRGLEIGTFTGYSALWFGMAFQETGGKLVTIEIDQQPGEEAQRNIRRAGLEAVIDARIVDAFSEIPKIPGDFDFVFIDAWKPDYMRFLKLLRERVAPGGALVAHNVTNHARDMQDFLKAIREDPGLETTLHEISAEGMSVSIVRGQNPEAPKHIQGLIQMLISLDSERAMKELAQAGDAAVPHLIEALADYSGHRYLPYRAALTLGRIGSELALQGLVDTLEDPSVRDYVQRGIIQALGEAGTDTTAQALIRIAGEESSAVHTRQTALTALGNYPTDEVVDLLYRVLRSEETALGYPCVHSLVKIGTDAALDRLVDVLRQHPGYLRGADVFQALKIKRPDSLLPILFETLKQDSWWNWNLASKALIDMGRPAEDTLIGMLRDESIELRRRSACILGKMPSEMAADTLVSLLDDEDWMVRNEAVVALARIHRGRPMRPLVEKILAEIPDARWAADYLSSDASQLERPGYADEIPPPAETLYDSDSRISLPVYPELLEEVPQVPSPIRTSDRQEYVTAVTKEGQYILALVTVANGEPYVYAQHGKGKQLAVDAEDFPALASTGLHSEEELDRALTITGRSLAEITALGRPERSSGVGFMARDEDIISVLKGDNRLAQALGLTHADLARPMFHMWNLVLEQTMAYRAQQRPYADIDYFLYNGKKVHIEAMEATKGWQESIFEDEIFGGYHIHIRRDLNPDETAFLSRRYAHLSPTQRSELETKLTRFHTGEMEPYYIMRYGFYEGHTDYRVDPITIAFIFGLKTLEELESAFPGQLYEVLTSHFIRK